MRSLAACLALAILTLAACGGDDGATPIDARRVDAATDAVAIDAPMIDAPMIDAPMIDAPDIDAPTIDAALIDAPAIDAIDATTIDTPPMTDASTVGQLQAIRDAVDGAINLQVDGATVTYLKPGLGNLANDPAGFTVQASQSGPAIFVVVDPASLAPAAAVGDIVSFTATNLATVAGQRRVTTITNYARLSTGANVGALAQNLTAATDLVTAVDSYDSEIVDVSGVVATTFAAAGAAFESAQITTTGMPTAGINLLVRLPATLRSSLDLVSGCHFTLDNTPVLRFNLQAELTAYVAADIAVSGCPAPTVVSATSLTPTSVRVTFDRNVLASSVMSDASQFSFNNGLTASAPVVSGRTVTLTTSPQSGATTYTVTVANTITDLQGSALGAPSSAMFGGFVVPAVLRLNEINANVTGGCDLIELRVIAAGSTSNFRITERVAASGDLNMTLPAVFVATNDIIVVHTASGNATCNPGTAVSETTSITQQPVATFTRNYDTAWDFWDADTGLTATDNVFTLFSPSGAIVDAVLASDDPTGTSAAGSTAAAATVATANQWQMVGGGVPSPNGFANEDFSMHAVLDLNGTGAVVTGTSIQRLDDTDDNDKADWNTATVTVQPNTFGARNVGQNAL